MNKQNKPMEYRKLTREELEKLFSSFGAKLNTTSNRDYLSYFQTYYPPSAARAIVQYNLEYNDEGYDCSCQYVGVYDKNGDELLPLKGKEREARKEWNNVFSVSDNGGYISEPVEDKIINIKSLEFPVLYVENN